MLIFFSKYVTFTQVRVSFARIDDLLAMEELEEYYTDPKDKNVAIKLNNLTTAWDVVEKQPTGEQREVLIFISAI